MRVEFDSINYIHLKPENKAERAIFKHWAYGASPKISFGGCTLNCDNSTISDITIKIEREEYNTDKEE